MNELTTITASTAIRFPAGETRGRSIIRYIQPHDDKFLVITDETPFHPLSNSWPDQEADTGTIEVDGTTYPVVDSLTAAFDPQNPQLLIGTAIPSKRETEGWYYLVAHIVELPSGTAPESLVGKQATLNVDEPRRAALSVAHTAGHLAAFAMSKSAADLWRKEVKLDGLGNPDLDQLAMDYSRMTPTGDTDRYRFGKSLRKKGGFDSAAFFERAERLTTEVNDQVRQWLDTKGAVIIKTTGTTLEAQRYWVCELDGKTVELPCGGTHPRSLAEIASITVRFEFSPEASEVTMLTSFELA